MPTKTRQRSKTIIPYGMSAKQMKRKKPINTELMREITPLTANQQILFDSYKNNLLIH